MSIFFHVLFYHTVKYRFTDSQSLTKWLCSCFWLISRCPPFVNPSSACELPIDEWLWLFFGRRNTWNWLLSCDKLRRKDSLEERREMIKKKGERIMGAFWFYHFCWYPPSCSNPLISKPRPANIRKINCWLEAIWLLINTAFQSV